MIRASGNLFSISKTSVVGAGLPDELVYANNTVFPVLVRRIVSKSSGGAGKYIMLQVRRENTDFGLGIVAMANALLWVNQEVMMLIYPDEELEFRYQSGVAGEILVWTVDFEIMRD